MKQKIISTLISLCLLFGTGQAALAVEIPEALLNVKNISQPTQTQYGAGQPDLASFEAFAKAGVKHVINLRPPEETPGINAAAVVTRAGMAYYNIPISGVADLTRDNVLLVGRLLKQIGNEPVLIHCSSSNRVGAVMALKAFWLEGVSRDEAIVTGNRWGLTKLQKRVEKILDQ